MAHATGKEHNLVVRKINATLRGPVVEALSVLVPEVRGLSRANALETILDDLELLERCFAAFRDSPDTFAELLVDRYRVPVEDAQDILECGRSLDDVVAMVVRTAAKRYFRHRLDGVRSTSVNGRSRRKRAKKPRGLFDRLRLLMAASVRTPQKTPKTRGELLYEAVRQYLLHDWQVPIIPEYCRMSPGQVRLLGASILDYRQAEDVRRLVDGPEQGRQSDMAPSAAPPPPAAPPIEARPVADQRISDGMAKLEVPIETVKDQRARLEDILGPDQKRLKASAFSVVLLDPNVRKHIPDSQQTVRLTTVLGSVGGMVGKVVVGELGLKTDQLAVFLMSCHAALGEQRFQAAFGVPGRLEYVSRLVERAKAFQIGQDSSLATISDFVGKTFRAAEQAGKGE